MNSFASVCSTLLLVASIHGGTSPVNKDDGWGSPMGWNGGAGAGQTNNQMVEVIDSTGQIGVFASEVALTEALGNPSNPASVTVDVGSGGNAFQLGSNYQQSASNSGESSSGYSGNTAESIGNGTEYITVTGQGDFLQVINEGQSIVDGNGVTTTVNVLGAQAEELGWKSD